MSELSYVAKVVRSTFRCVAVLALLSAAPALAMEVPQFSKGGFLVTLEYSPFASWNFDRTTLASQVTDPLAGVFINEAQASHTASLGLSYNILGHASIGADFTATGWNLFDPNRGGAGFLVGKVAWHPLQLVWMHKEERPAGVDLAVGFGVGYGIAGQDTGMDGLVTQLHFDGSFFFSKYFGLGLFGRVVFLGFDKFYLDYYGRAQPGNTIALPKGPGGTFVTGGLALHFRAGD